MINGTRTEHHSTPTSDDNPSDYGRVVATTRELRNIEPEGAFPVLVGETTVTVYWQPAADGREAYLVVDIDTSENSAAHLGLTEEPINLKVTVNDGTVYGQD
jgi:hypothetical protein